MVSPGAPILRLRRTWSAEEKAELLALFADSGMTAADFCAEFNVHPATFSLWRRTATPRSSGVNSGEEAASNSAPQFARVCMTEPLPLVGATDAVVAVVHLLGEVRLDIKAGIDPVWLGQLLRSIAYA